MRRLMNRSSLAIGALFTLVLATTGTVAQTYYEVAVVRGVRPQGRETPPKPRQGRAAPQESRAATDRERCADPDPAKNLNLNHQFFEVYRPVSTDAGTHPYQDHYSAYPDAEGRFRNVWYHTVFPISELNRTFERWVQPPASDPANPTIVPGGLVQSDDILLGLRRGDSFVYGAEVIPFHLADVEDPNANLGHIYDYEVPPSDAIRCDNYVWVFEYDPATIAVDRVIDRFGTLAWWKRGQIAVFMEKPIWCDRGSCHIPAIPQDYFVKLQARLIGDPGPEVRPFRVTLLNAGLMAKAPTGLEGNAPTGGACTDGQYGIRWCMQKALSVHWDETAPNASLAQSAWPSSGEIIAQLKAEVAALAPIPNHALQLRIAGFISNPETRETFIVDRAANTSGISAPWSHVLAENRRTVLLAQGVVGTSLAERTYVYLAEKKDAWPQEQGVSLETNPRLTIRQDERSWAVRDLTQSCNVVDATDRTGPGGGYVDAEPLLAMGGATIALHPASPTPAGRFTTPIRERVIPAWTGSLLWKVGYSKQIGIVRAVLTAIDQRTGAAASNGPSAGVLTLEPYLSCLRAKGFSYDSLTPVPVLLPPETAAALVLPSTTPPASSTPPAPTTTRQRFTWPLGKPK